jgi:hypothetical protein
MVIHTIIHIKNINNMAKLIRSSIECAHNIQKICFHDPSHLKLCICEEEQNFPKACPLEDGTPQPGEFQYNKSNKDYNTN